MLQKTELHLHRKPTAYATDTGDQRFPMLQKIVQIIVP